jgi:hypothetical protein
MQMRLDLRAAVPERLGPSSDCPGPVPKHRVQMKVYWTKLQQKLKLTMMKRKVLLMLMLLLLMLLMIRQQQQLMMMTKMNLKQDSTQRPEKPLIK